MKKIARILNSALTLIAAFMVSIFTGFSALVPQVMAEGLDASPVEYEIAKTFSETLCETMEDGLSINSALDISQKKTTLKVIPKILGFAFQGENLAEEKINEETVSTLVVKMARKCVKSENINTLKDFLHTQIKTFQS